MSKNIDRSSILQMARGAFQERVDYEMGRVVDNILDLNTKATAKRKITLTIELTPDDERQTISVAVQAKRRRSRPPTRSQRPSTSPATATAKWSWPKWCRRSPAKLTWTALSRRPPRS